MQPVAMHPEAWAARVALEAMAALLLAESMAAQALLSLQPQKARVLESAPELA